MRNLGSMFHKPNAIMHEHSLSRASEDKDKLMPVLVSVSIIVGNGISITLGASVFGKLSANNS